MAFAQSPDFPPLPTENVSRVTSLVADAGLEGCNLFNLDFERAPGQPRDGTVWIATSKGLVRYDGYRWERFGTDHGLPSDFIRCVLVNPDATVWVGTDRGAGVFDGATFDPRGSENGLAGANVRRMMRDRDGTVWFCSDSWPDASARGGLSSFRDGQWRQFRQEDGLRSEYVLNFLHTTSGDRYAVTLKGLSKASGARWIDEVSADQWPGVQWSGAVLAESPTLGVVLSTGLRVFRRERDGWNSVPTEGRHGYGMCATDDSLLITTLSTESGIHRFAELTPSGWRTASDPFDVTHDYLEDVREAPDGSVWAVGFDTLVRWGRRPKEWRQFDDALEPQFVDAQDRVWFARHRGPGVEDAPVQTWSEASGWRWHEPPCNHLVLDDRGDVWGLSTNAVVRWSGEQVARFTAESLGLSKIISGRPARTNEFWVLGRLANHLPAITTWDGRRWNPRTLTGLPADAEFQGVARSRHGLWMIARSAGSTQAVAVLAGLELDRRWHLPARQLSMFRFGILEDSRDRVWMHGDGGALVKLGMTEVGSWEPVPELPTRIVFGALERGSELWLGCNGANGGTSALVRLLPQRQDTLKADLLYSLGMSTEGDVLAAGPGKFYIVPPGPDATPEAIDLPTRDLVSSVVGGRRTGYWAGTEGRVYRFMPRKEPPDTILRITAMDVLEGTPWQATAVAIQRFRRTGSSSDLRFSWRLDGGAWSTPNSWTELTIPTTGLRSGRHRLEVRAHGFGNIVDASPDFAFLNVHPLPIQSRAWFIPGLGAVLVMMSALAVAAALARRRVAGYASQLETRVAERSAQLEQDVAKRLRVEASLSRLVKAAPGAIFAFRLHPDGRCAFEFASPSLESLVGVSLDVLRVDASRTFEKIPPEDRAELFASLHRDGQHLAVWNHIFPFHHPSRGMLWIEGRGAPEPSSNGSILWHGFLVDVTSRVQSEQELTRQRTRLAGVVEGALDGILSTDETRRVVIFNPAAERIFRCRASDVLNRGIERFIPESRRTAAAEDPVWCFARPDDHLLPSSGGGHSTGRRADGTEFPLEASWVQLNVHGQRLVTLTFRDVTALHEAEATRTRLEAQLRQAQKLEAIGTLAGGIAHDFNNILAAIVGNLDCLRDLVPPQGEAAESLDEIRHASLRARALVQQILAFGRREATQRVPVPVQPIVEETLRFLRSGIPAGVRLETQIAADCPPILGDPTQFQQILVNLCTNAWQAMNHRAGHIEIRARELDPKSATSTAAGLELPSPGRAVHLSVHDDGHGMDAATCERIFEPFYTTKPPGAGTGLGLSVVHGIVRGFHGVIRVTSTPGVGTTFDLLLPAADASSPTPMSLPPPPPQAGAGRRILYLDDERPLVTVATRMLQRLGYRVTAATDADEALAHFHREPNAFAVVISDLHLPAKSGLIVAAAIHQVRPSLPVVITSGEITESLRADATHLGIRGLLPKPASVEELTAVLREVLGEPESAAPNGQ